MVEALIKTKGFKSADFHSICDNKGKMIIIIKSEQNYIFGAYADKSFNKYGNYI